MTEASNLSPLPSRRQVGDDIRPLEPRAFGPPLKFAADQDAETGRWFVVDTGNAKCYPYPIGYATQAEAEAFMDRLNAAHEGESASVIEDLRRDSDALRGQQS